MLDLAFVLALSQTCAPSVSAHTLAAVAHVESRFDPLAIGVNTGPRPPRRPRDTTEAAAWASALIARGHSVDLGLAQINSANLDWLGLSVEAAFDPCRNLEAAATVLRAGYRPAGTSPEARQAALRIALSRYNTGDARRGFRNGYVARVEGAARRLGLAAVGPPVPLPGPDRVQSPGPTPGPVAPWDIFARARADVLVFSSPPARSRP